MAQIHPLLSHCFCPSCLFLLLVALFLHTATVHGQCGFTSPDRRYAVKWTYDPLTDRVNFSLATEKHGTHFWSGIGIGNVTGKSEMMVVVSTDTDSMAFIEIYDRGFAKPMAARMNKLQAVNISVENGVLFANFSRPVKFPDQEMLPLFDESSCQIFLFPFAGGTVQDTENGLFIQKKNTPLSQRICHINLCLPQPALSNAMKAEETSKNLLLSPLVPLVPTAGMGVAAVPDLIQTTGNKTADVHENEVQIPNLVYRPSPLQPQSPLVTDTQSSIVKGQMMNGVVLGHSQWTGLQPGAPALITPTVHVVNPLLVKTSTNQEKESKAGKSPVSGFEQKVQTQTNLLSPVIDVLSLTNQIRTTADVIAQNLANATTTDWSGSRLSALDRLPSPLCEFHNGDYHAFWHYDDQTDTVTFNLTIRLPVNKFSGIVFGKPPQARDAVVVQNMDHQLVVADMHISELDQYVTDMKQDISDIQSKMVSGDTVRVSFSRPVAAFDAEDRPLEDNAISRGCQFFSFLVEPGDIALTASRMVMKTPVRPPEEQLVCHVSKCSPRAAAPLLPGQVATTTTITTASTARGAPLAMTATSTSNNSHRTTSGFVSVANQSAPFCQNAEDNPACKQYIDSYLKEVYSKYPRIDKVTRKACSVLIMHQEGEVYRECCRQLETICYGLIKEFTD